MKMMLLLIILPSIACYSITSDDRMIMIDDHNDDKMMISENEVNDTEAEWLERQRRSFYR